MTRKPSSPTARLLAHGWTRSDAPADLLNECGSETYESICSRLARWEHPSFRGHYCAHHATPADEQRRRQERA